MTFFQAIILGIIQGLTEYLPISSTAHLRIIPALLDWKDPGAAFTAVIQWGTLVAVLIYFRRDIGTITRAVLVDLRAGRPLQSAEARLGWMIAAGTVPVVALGLLFKNQIETTLRSLYVISGAMITLALVLSLAEWLMRRWQLAGHKQKHLEDLGWFDVMVVGCWQALALIPGASRSGVTITGALFQNMTRETAARFSFLLSLPAVFGAGVFQLYKERHALLASEDDIVNLVTATVVSGVVGYATIAFLLNFLKTHTTGVFIVYRLAVGCLLLALIRYGNLSPEDSPASPHPDAVAQGNSWSIDGRHSDPARP